MAVYIDISNYVLTRAHTGIQRVVREFLFRIVENSHNLDYCVIYYENSLGCFHKIFNDELLSFLENSSCHKFNIKKNDTIKIDSLISQDIFFDMDGAWNNGLKRSFLYPILKENNVYIYNFIYDLIPIKIPSVSHGDTVRNFTMYLFSIYQYSDLVLFDSQSAEDDFLEIKNKINNNNIITTKVAKLGEDITNNGLSILDRPFTNKKYLLFVGTLEPRKNQKLLVTVFEKLSKIYKDLNLVLVGRVGWDNKEFIDYINDHKLLNSRFFVLKDVGDKELITLYKNAYISVYLSIYEGFGLPIAESLGHGNITITSKNSSMYEVGKNYADYLTYNSANELYDILDLYLSNESLYNLKKKFISDNYTNYTWDQLYRNVVTCFENINKHNIKSSVKLQFVFISIHIDKLEGTIKSIDKYIDFVDEYIVVTSKEFFSQIKLINSVKNIKIVDELDILKEYSEGFRQRDHQSKNWLLRASLLNIPYLQEHFIMLDDDNRPIRKIDIEHFIQSGKYNCYYCYDLLKWNNNNTDYDIGQRCTRDVLDAEGFELRSYSSHKPQIINKRIFTEVVHKYFDIGLIEPLDEWSIYFNYAITMYPNLFVKKKYDTLFWPGNYSDWNLITELESFQFENFYDSFNLGLSIEKKISMKETELGPYRYNKNAFKANTNNYMTLNMVHGVLSFENNDTFIYLASVPYYIEAKKKSWVKLCCNYKIVNGQNKQIQLIYYINDEKVLFKPLIADNIYSEDVIDFGISVEALNVGEYELVIDAYIDGVPVYGFKSPYMVKLFVRD